MTRYTKLEKRKAPLAASHFEFAGRAPSASPQPESEQDGNQQSATAVGTPEDVEQAGPSVKRHKPEDTQRIEETDPTRLRKRVKLLRLKAKKATSPEARQKYLSQAAECERAANKAQGDGKKTPRREGHSNKGEGEGRKRKRDDRSDGAKAQEKEKEVNPWKAMEKERRVKSEAKSEARREARAAERAANTKCFACRQTGHAARDCPERVGNGPAIDPTALDGDVDATVASGGDESSNAPAQDAESTRKIAGKDAVGICFRCGSTQHILAKCRRPPPRVGDDLPFATCFVCGAKGHLASKCPQNAGRGIYPHGGCCKLCESVEHLAKDCPTRKDATLGTTVLGVPDAAMNGMRGQRATHTSADDDDFIAMARARTEVDKEERSLSAQAKKAASGQAALSARAPQRKSGKVVSF